MNFRISAWAIHNPLPPIMLFIALSILGISSFQSLTITDMPAASFPQVTVTIGQSGAAPSEMETQVTRVVEGAVGNVQGISNVTSSVSEGQSQTTVEFDQNVPLDRALDDVRDAISQIRSDLPAAASEPVVQRNEDIGGPIGTYTVQAPSLSPEDLSWMIDGRITRLLKAIPGVASVTRQGGTEREIRVELDPLRLQALNVTVAEINNLLNQAVLDRSGGRGEIGGQEQSFRIVGAISSIQELASLELRLPNGQDLALGDLASISDSQTETRSVAFMNGDPVVAFSVAAATGYSAPEVAAKIEAQLSKFNEELEGVTITQIDNAVAEVEAAYTATMDTLIEGAILAIVVVFLFLKDFRATMIAALAIPLSILPTFWVINLLGFSLNNVSLLAITMVTGVLVDDAIVETENIIRHIRMGKSPFQAAVEAADEIGLAVIATSGAIVAIFLPVSFMSGFVGQIFKQFGVTIAISVVFSTLVARLITPLLAAYFIKAPEDDKPEVGPVLLAYKAVLDWAIRWRFLTVMIAVGIFVGSIGLALQLSSSFFPEENGTRSELIIELPQGVNLQDAANKLLQISDKVAQNPFVETVYASIGTGGDLSSGSVSVSLMPATARDVGQRDVERAILADLAVIPDVMMNFSNGQGGHEFGITLAGADGAAVSQKANELEAAMRDRVPALRNVRSRASIVRPELQISPRRTDAAELGVSLEEIANITQIATLGDFSQNLAKLSDGERLIDIKVLLPKNARQGLASIESLLLRGNGGTIVPLSAVADVSKGVGPAGIERQNGQRLIQIEGDLAQGADLGSAVEQLMALEEIKQLPAGIVLAEMGDSEMMTQVFSSFFKTMGIGLMLVLIVLILLYSDLFQPITILLSLPLSIGGAILALLMTGHGMTLPVIIGMLMLIAIVTKNAILIIDFALEEIRRGTNRKDALIEAGLKRAQPIVMTTVAMTAGMLPAALATGSGDAFRAPMAISVIGGLIASTILSLVFVPAAFTYLDDLKCILAKLFGRLITHSEETHEMPDSSPHLATVPDKAAE